MADCIQCSDLVLSDSLDGPKSVGGYRKIRDLGMGSYGKAILVEHVATGQQCVMKAIDITRLQPQQREQSINEVRLLGQMKHPFIIMYKESFMVNGFLCIITEFADGGDLNNAVLKRRQARRLRGGIVGFPEKQVLRWIIQCVLALKHLHLKHILHRDVKTQNIFLSTNGRIRLGDFGIAKALDKTGSFAKTIIGTPYYLSPEICRSLPYSWASDIWALGCVLYELCALKVPFEANNMTSLVTRIVDGKPPMLPAQYSEDLKDLYFAMLSKNPADRPTPGKILGIPFIRNECFLMLKDDASLRHEICPLTPDMPIEIPRPVPTTCKSSTASANLVLVPSSRRGCPPGQRKYLFTLDNRRAFLSQFKEPMAAKKKSWRSKAWRRLRMAFFS
ncbi:protein serine/threonine kinase catalytic domain protein [Gregarina niphandrodes]|uniref:non-specific serine/threonine protein kinase n=1 Tax=Gregarina niphandrodes TaxID=110365 RepID=A0A023B296_GRENI|nr:protein serine/threonine kinase catalytic domain protein [Gregarina niphandrodes]EZG51798.1 protein serine/threonine kinase catalytic domain protein [Gregarina niphandrodes]|eukprot:XP_011131909.1 protein serine/threonine kinase catalytic domain protein [Gregarina niphandrodes]